MGRESECICVELDVCVSQACLGLSRSVEVEVEVCRTRSVEAYRATNRGLSRLCRVSRLGALTPGPHGVSDVLCK